MHIIIDFDYTLYDTHRLRSLLMDAAADFGITHDDYQAAEARIKQRLGVYDWQAHIAEMLSHATKAEQLRERWKDIVDHSEACVYPDARDFLQRYEQERITVLTFGSPEWQQCKIAGSGIVGLTDRVYATDQPKSEALTELVQPDEQTVVITDRGSEIDELFAIAPELRYVWCHRLDTPYVDEQPEHADVEWENLIGDLLTLNYEKRLLRENNRRR